LYDTALQACLCPNMSEQAEARAGSETIAPPAFRLRELRAWI
jgi:hypothetical protein